MTRGLRFWTSGCAAVVSLALAGAGDIWAEDGADSRPGRLQVSRHDLASTLHRLQACAPRHGLTVMAHWAPPGVATVDTSQRCDARFGTGAGASRSVLVFASLSGGTPVLMAGDGARPAVPLSLHLRTRGDGIVEVLLPALPQPGLDEDMPAELARDITSLPALVSEALG